MRYYKIVENNILVAIGTGEGGEEISKEKYEELFKEIQMKAELVYAVFNGEKSIEEVPVEWRSEISERVELLKIRLAEDF